ncbi:MAG: hypothetical protein ACUVV3_03010 [Dehalococcoidia bacterium]
MPIDRGKATLFGSAGVIALALLGVIWAVGVTSSGAQQGAMQNCPQAGKWAISVWSGADGTDAGQALATCGVGVVDFAYYLDPVTNGWLGYFEGRPEASKLETLDGMQGVIAHGAVGAPPPTPSPSPGPIVFTGQGDKTTSVFSVSTWSFEVGWTTTSDSPEWASFAFFVYPEGETVVYACDADFDGVGSDSTVCRGGPGRFYIKVLAANLSSWRIEVGAPPGVSSLPATFTGRGDKATPAFRATASSFTVSWTTASDSPEWASFAFFVYPEGETVMYACDADFDGVGSDSTVCHAGPGDFYVEVLAANLTSWRLDITE